MSKANRCDERHWFSSIKRPVLASRTLLYVLEDNEAVIKMIIKGRSPLMRHTRKSAAWWMTWSGTERSEGCHQVEWRRQQPPPDLGLRGRSEWRRETSFVQKLAESLSTIVESLNSASKEKGTEKVKRVSGPKNLPRKVSGMAHSQRQNAAGNRQPWPQPKEGGRAIEKPKGKGKGKGKSGRKAKGKGKGLTSYACRGIGHPARLCPSERWVNDLEQDAPEGEDTNEEGCWTEEDYETLQLEYFGSEPWLMSSTGTARCIQWSWMDRGDPQVAKSPAMLQATWVL